MNKLLGSKIKALRISNDLTQEEVADSVGISRQKYARIENGQNNINLDILSKLSVLFNIKVSDITAVLDETPIVEYRGNSTGDVSDVFEMIDTFYANKHVYEKLKMKDY